MRRFGMAKDELGVESSLDWRGVKNYFSTTIDFSQHIPPTLSLRLSSLPFPSISPYHLTTIYSFFLLSVVKAYSLDS